MQDDILRRAFEVFPTDAAAIPPLTLRGGNAVDDYAEPPPYDPRIDEPTDAYLERYAFSGLVYLDPVSWRYYLPRLIDYALGHLASDQAMVIDALLGSLRPPDRDPPRLATLTPEQETLIVAFLEYVAFGEDSTCNRDLAMQVLEEWWLPNPLYRR